MGNFSGFLQATDMTDAISKSRSPSGYKDLVIVNNSAKPNQFTLFMIFNKATATEIIYSCKRNTGTSFKVLADNSKANIVTDYGFKDMVKTILALERMPDTVKNPVTYTGSLPAIDDKQEKLMASAILFHSLAHNSPIENRNEVEQGVFSDYIQFADSVVRSWGTIGTTASGFERLEEIYELILAQNKGDLIDPVYVRNNGTLSEWAKKEEERKNYVYCNGYSRLNLEISYSKPIYAPVEYGTGVMFKVSNNIQLFIADTVDTLNMFEAPFLAGGIGSSRIIIPMDDTLISKMLLNGLWVKGNRDSSDIYYYTGIKAVRIPVECINSGKKIGMPFSIPNDCFGNGDSKGTLLSGMQNNIAIWKKTQMFGDRVDTIKNSGGLINNTATTILHYNMNYKEPNNTIFFQIDANKSKEISAEKDGTDLIIKAESDSSSGKVKIVAGEITTIDDKNVISRAIEVSGDLGGLGIKDGAKGPVEVWGTGLPFPSGTLPDYSSVYNVGIGSVAIDTSKLISLEKRENAIIKIKVSTNLKIFKSRNMEVSDQIYPGNSLGDISNGISWKTYYDKILKLDSLFFVGKKGDVYQVEFCLHERQNSPVSGSELIKVIIPKVVFPRDAKRICKYGYDDDPSVYDRDIISLSKDDITNLIFGIQPYIDNKYKGVSSDSTIFKVKNNQISKVTQNYLLSTLNGSNKINLNCDSAWFYINTQNGMKIDSLKVAVYKKRIVNTIKTIAICDSSSYGTYVDKSWLQGELNTKIDDVNNLYKQAIVEIADFSRVEVFKTDFDLNQNGALDLVEDIPDPFKDSEYDISVRYAKSLFSFADSVEPKLIFVKEIRRNWVIDTIISPYIIRLITSKDLEIKTEPVRMYLGEDAEFEAVNVIRVENNDCILQNPLKKTHSKSDYLYFHIGGMSIPTRQKLQFLSLRTGVNASSIVHELSHCISVAGLSDVTADDIDNIMIYNSGLANGDYLLRYRPVRRGSTLNGTPLKGFDQQWNMIVR